MYDIIQKEQFSNRITEFQFFFKKTEPFLKQLRGDLSNFLMNKQYQLSAYQGMSKMFDVYEELNLSHYSDMDVSKLILNNPEHKEIRENMMHTTDNLKNPFIDLYHWVKGEWYDLNSIKQAIDMRADVAKQIAKLQSKKDSTQKNLDSVNQGKKTIGTLFKN